MIERLSSADQRFLDAMKDLNARAQRAQREVTTGRRVFGPGDDPDRVSNLLQTRSDLDRMEQIEKNLSRAKTEVDIGERAMESVVKALERANAIALNGASDTSDPGSRAILGDEVTSLLQQLVNTSATQVEGRFIFGGDRDGVIPYTIDPMPPNLISPYGGSPSTKRLQHPSGDTFPVALTAEQIFEDPDPDRNVFANLRALRDALEANDVTAIRDTMVGLKGSLDHVIRKQAFYGAVQTRIAEADATAKANAVQLKTQIASIEDADLVESILDLNRATQNQQAALQAQGRMPRTSLFDYLG
jgi:flagellar hook-associated protein 3 FlgL